MPNWWDFSALIEGLLYWGKNISCKRDIREKKRSKERERRDKERGETRRGTARGN